MAIEAEAVVEGKHDLLLIVAAVDRERVERFLAFLTRFGSVEVFPACSSEAAVARGGCLGRGMDGTADQQRREPGP